MDNDRKREEAARNPALAQLREQIRGRRTSLGLSQRDLAVATNFTYQYISSAERGPNFPSAELVSALDKALQAGGVLIELRDAATAERSQRGHRAPSHPTASPSDPTGHSSSGRASSRKKVSDELGLFVDHRSMPKESVGASACLDDAACAATSLSWLTTDVGSIDIDLLIEARCHYESMYRRVGGLVTLPKLTRFLNLRAAPFLSRNLGDSVERNLYRAFGGLLALAGICSYDSGQHLSATNLYEKAAWFSSSSGDVGLDGYIRALMVNQALALAAYKRAAELATSCLEAPAGGLSFALRADLSAMRAKAYAGLGEPRAARSSMAFAESCSGQVRRANEPVETDYVQPGLVEIQLAEALIDMRDLGAAREYSEESFRLNTHPRGKVNRLASMVEISLADRDIDRAAVFTFEMLRCASGMESKRLNDRFQKIHSWMGNIPSRASASALERLGQRLQISL